MLYYEKYEHQPSGRICNQVHQYMLLRGESSIFTWLHRFPPTIPDQFTLLTLDAASNGIGNSEDTVMTNTEDTSVETVPNGTVDDAMDDNPLDSDTNTSDLVDELGKAHIALRAQSK